MWAIFGQLLLAAIGGSALTLGALSWLSKKFVESQLAKDLERFKTGLSLSLFEFSTKFSKLHEKRTEVIENVYEKIYLAFSNVRVAARYGDLNLKYDLKAVHESTSTLNEYFQEKKIFLPNALVVSIQSLFDEIFKVELILANESNVRADESRQNRVENFNIALDAVHITIPRIMGEIEEQIRNILDTSVQK